MQSVYLALRWHLRSSQVPTLQESLDEPPSGIKKLYLKIKKFTIMGLDISGARFLLGEKTRSVFFGHTLTLGRQGIYMGEKPYHLFLDSIGVKADVSGYADDFFRGLGAEPLIAIDASHYEGASIVHDMNLPIDPQYNAAFDTVIDGGTLEHIFNFPVAIRNCMEMVKPGGQLILMTPWHNYPGHGFFEFSPELIYNTLSEENGFRVEKMLIDVEGNWYSVKNPVDLQQRIEISTRDPVLLYVTARKISSCQLFLKWPQQSDYSAAWQRGSYGTTQQTGTSSIKSSLIKIFPVLEKLRDIWRRHKSHCRLSPRNNPGLVRIGPSHIIPM
jgi:SAM-dependent methyltransferase